MKIILFILMISDIGFASFREGQLRYLSPIDLKSKLIFTLPIGTELLWQTQPLDPYISINSSKYDLYLNATFWEAISSWGLNSPFTGDPFEMTPTARSILNLEDLVNLLITNETSVLDIESSTTENFDFKKARADFLKKYFPKFDPSDETQNQKVALSQYWSSLSPEDKKSVFKYWIERTLGTDEIIQSFSFTSSDQLVEHLVLSTENNEPIAALKTSLRYLLLRDEFLTY